MRLLAQHQTLFKIDMCNPIKLLEENNATGRVVVHPYTDDLVQKSTPLEGL